MRFERLPEGFERTRDELHQIAFFALSPVRYKAVGRMGLRHYPGGLGTPEFDGRVARVDGNLLVHEQGGAVATRTIETIRDAAEFLGLRYVVEWYPEFHDPPAPADPDRHLIVDVDAVDNLEQWFGFGFEVLERLRSDASRYDQPSEVQLWPEHFDAATEIGDQAKGQRASYGASPGDEAHPSPYLYVSAWGEIDRTDGFWNDDSFNGASLGYGELRKAGDPFEAALAFYRKGLEALHR